MFLDRQAFAVVIAFYHLLICLMCVFRDGGLPAYEEMCKFLGVKAVGSQFAFSDRTVLKVRINHSHLSVT